MKETCHWKSKSIRKQDGNYANEDEDARSKIAKTEAKESVQNTVAWYLITILPNPQIKTEPLAGTELLYVRSHACVLDALRGHQWIDFCAGTKHYAT